MLTSGEKGEKTLVAVFNFSDEEQECVIEEAENRILEECMNSDWHIYGGSTEKKIEVIRDGEIVLAPFSGRLFGVKKRFDINKHYKNLLVNCNTIRRSYKL